MVVGLEEEKMCFDENVAFIRLFNDSTRNHLRSNESSCFQLGFRALKLQIFFAVSQ